MRDLIHEKRVGSNVRLIWGRKPKFKEEMGGPADMWVVIYSTASGMNTSTTPSWKNTSYTLLNALVTLNATI